jgi:CBS domain-containing protein
MQIITTHKDTDFDAAASVLAAKILYPEAVAVLPKSLNPNVRAFLSIHKDLFDVHTPDKIELEEVMSLIIVDTNRWDRLDQMDRLKEKENLEIILWDHHLNEGNIDATWKCMDAAFGIFVHPKRGNIIVIGRSGTDGLDVGLIMRALGGGGHPAAGSALIKSVNSDAVEQMIVNLISGNQPATVQIGDLMSYPVVTLSPDTRMKEVYTILREKGHMGIPVLDDGRLVGIISRRDFWKAKKTSALNAPVRAFMTKNVVTIKPGKSPMQAARLMIQHDIGRLPVVENGRVIGIVTRSDTMHYFYDLLPE